MAMPPPSPSPTPKMASTILLAFALICSSTAFHAVPSPSLLRNHHVSPTKASSIRQISQSSPLHPNAARSKKTFIALSSTNNNDNMPSQEEIAEQKSQAYNAFSSFHETSSLASSSPSDQIKSLLAGLETLGMEEEEEVVKPEHWSCENGAITYVVPMDPAAGLKRGKISKPYKASVQLEMDLGELTGGVKRRGLRLVESIQFGDDGDNISIPFVRSIPLGANVDVDAVDGSYSLDDTINQVEGDSPPLPLMPPSMLAGVDPMAVKFVVEHTLAVSETERCRCFLLYGDAVSDGTVTSNLSEDDEDVGDEDFAIMAARKAKKEFQSDKAPERNYRLLAVVLAEETKVMPEQEQDTVQDAEIVDYASDFASQIIESPSPAPATPLDLLEVKSSSEEPKNDMDQLMESLEKHNKQVMESSTPDGGGDGNQNTMMERHSLGMFGLTSGVWLGDTFVRESIPSAIQLARARQSRQNKGFGKQTKTDNENDENGNKEEDRFATWSMGVQKVALLFGWDYSKSISQSYTYGKVMGTATSFSSMANVRSDGIVVVDEGRRTKKREERRVVWDMDGGQYVAGLIGSSYFRAPRYMSFTQSRSYSADAYLTEFMVFYRPEKDDDASPPLSSSSRNDSKPPGGEIDEDDATPEYYCSRTSRLYNANDGNLMQGSTAFFSLTPSLLEQSD